MDRWQRLVGLMDISQMLSIKSHHPFFFPPSLFLMSQNELYNIYSLRGYFIIIKFKVHFFFHFYNHTAFPYCWCWNILPLMGWYSSLPLAFKWPHLVKFKFLKFDQPVTFKVGDPPGLRSLPHLIGPDLWNSLQKRGAASSPAKQTLRSPAPAYQLRHLAPV